MNIKTIILAVLISLILIFGCKRLTESDQESASIAQDAPPIYSWDFVDGGEETSINPSLSDALHPQLAEFNGKLYTIWTEDLASLPNQIHIAEWDGASTWNYVDGARVTGINKVTENPAFYGRLSVFNSNLYAIWCEYNDDSVSQIRVAKWDGADSWNFIDGDGADGLNRDTAQRTFVDLDYEYASLPQMVADDSYLYAIWNEAVNTENVQIRVARWDGNNWFFIDGDGINGINKDPEQPAAYPYIALYNSRLYATWTEVNNRVGQIRIAKWDGSNTWQFVDGNGVYGINKNTSMHSGVSRLAVFESKLYITWFEQFGISSQVHVAEWDGSSIWTLIDGGDHGLNKDPNAVAMLPYLASADGKLYLTWEEVFAGRFQIRVAEWDGTSSWTFKDGNRDIGINKDYSQHGYAPNLISFQSNIYTAWHEWNRDFKNYQLRVAAMP